MMNPVADPGESGAPDRRSHPPDRLPCPAPRVRIQERGEGAGDAAMRRLCCAVASLQTESARLRLDMGTQ